MFIKKLVLVTLLGFSAGFMVQAADNADNKEDSNVRAQRGFVNVGDVRPDVGPGGDKHKNKNKNKGGGNTNVPRDFKDE